MRIEIAEKLKPFSHQPGMFLLLPGTSLRFQLFPCLIRIYDLSHSEPKFIEELSLEIKGPVKEFTGQMDLEQGSIKVWGYSSSGYFRYRICAMKDQIHWVIVMEKAPSTGMIWKAASGALWIKKTQAKDWQPLKGEIQPKDVFSLHKQSSQEFYIPHKTDRLSLGNHKSQDWELVKRRQSLEEILPIWFRMGQLLPPHISEKFGNEGTLYLLQVCRRAMEEKNQLTLYDSFLNIFNAGFEGIMSPRLVDDDYQGFNLPPLSSSNDLSPLLLLKQGAELIRALFFQFTDNEFLVLPLLPREFTSGRLIGLESKDIATLDIEWTKKHIRRMVINGWVGAQVRIAFPKQIKRCRLRQGRQEIGNRRDCPLEITIEEGKTYTLDNYET